MSESASKEVGVVCPSPFINSLLYGKSPCKPFKLHLPSWFSITCNIQVISRNSGGSCNCMKQTPADWLTVVQDKLVFVWLMSFILGIG